MSKSTRMSVSEYVKSFAARAESYSVPEHRADSAVSQWQDRQIARMGRIAEHFSADVSEFDYEPVDFADADYILKGMSAILKSACTSKKVSKQDARKNGVKAAQKAVETVKENRQPTMAEIGEMVCKGKLGKVAQKRAVALVG